MKKLSLFFCAMLMSGAMMAEEAKETLTDKEQEFAKMAAMGGIAEVEAGELATKNAEHRDVKEFGRDMVRDHTKANKALMKVAEKKGLTLPTETDEKHKAALAKLGELKGEEFDKAYLAQMQQDHEMMIKAFTEASTTVQDKDLKKFVEANLPVLKEHKEHLTKIMSDEGKRNPAADADKKADS